MQQLAEDRKKSRRWIQQELDSFSVKKSIVKPCPIVAVADMTFVKKTFGICVFRAPHLKKNLIWKMSLTEKLIIYHELKWRLEKQGFRILAAVVDGKPGLFEVFHGIPVQMCHFHQIQIVTRYLTTRPKLSASQVLRRIALWIPKSNEKEMTEVLDLWFKEWKDFLKEKTQNLKTKKWFYTHKRLRSAYRSFRRNLPYLYTYQKYPKLNIPNTTNSLEGTFSHLKDMLRIHRGLRKKRKLKLVDEILSK